MSYETITLEVSDFIATVTLNRPPVNALSRPMRLELIDAFDELNDRADVRCIILTAQGFPYESLKVGND